ncbi:MAG: hypothetical protein RRB22_01325 [Gammaproteobacteria bacterium]|nr:hypothetical protein [Gammaproteobacteria bacterium]
MDMVNEGCKKDQLKQILKEVSDGKKDTTKQRRESKIADNSVNISCGNIYVGNHDHSGKSINLQAAVFIIIIAIFAYLALHVGQEAHASKTIVIQSDGDSLESLKRQAIKLFENNRLDFTP